MARNVLNRTCALTGRLLLWLKRRPATFILADDNRRACSSLRGRVDTQIGRTNFEHEKSNCTGFFLIVTCSRGPLLYLCPDLFHFAFYLHDAKKAGSYEYNGVHHYSPSPLFHRQWMSTTTWGGIAQQVLALKSPLRNSRRCAAQGRQCFCLKKISLYNTKGWRTSGRTESSLIESDRKY